uniref:Putative secreted protein n=1 Tax=Ixodes ricinus TaxID=34613 RepID=A0A6B0UJ65_IXORI
MRCLYCMETRGTRAHANACFVPFFFFFFFLFVCVCADSTNFMNASRIKHLSAGGEYFVIFFLLQRSDFLTTAQRSLNLRRRPVYFLSLLRFDVSSLPQSQVNLTWLAQQ